MADARNGGAVPLEADAVLFDNDGVLVDSHDQVVLAWGRLAVELGLDIDVLLADLAGVRAVDTLGRHLPPDETARPAVRLKDLEVELAGSTRPLPGALELIDQLQSRPWAIVTSAGRRLAVARWRGAGVPVPSVAITAEDVSSGKPDSEPFLVAAAALGVQPSRAWRSRTRRRGALLPKRPARRLWPSAPNPGAANLRPGSPISPRSPPEPARHRAPSCSRSAH